MKRLICTLVGAVVLMPFAANAQRHGGGMAGAGRAPGGAMRSGGGGMRSGPIAAPRVGPAAPRMVPASAARRTGARFGASSRRFGFAPNRFHHRHGRFFGFSNCFGGFNCFNNGFGFGWPYYGYYPFYSDFDSSYPSYDSSYPSYEPTASTDNASEIELAQAVQKLSDEIDDLRNEQRRNASPERTTPVPSSSESKPACTPTATTFVLRDGNHLTAQNYAIAGESLWIMDDHRSRKIDLADVDRSATEQLNAANGVDLKLP